MARTWDEEHQLWRLRDAGRRRGDRALRHQRDRRLRRPEAGGDPGPRRLRREGHPLVTLGPRLRPQRQARRRRRHGRERGADRPRDRARGRHSSTSTSARRSGSSPKFDPKIPGWSSASSARVPADAARDAGGRQRDHRVHPHLRGRQLPPRAGSRRADREARTGASWRSAVRDPELRRKLTPDYGIGCKRPSVSNHYLRTFNRDNVELVTDAIERITPAGIRTADGQEREVDAIVLATGFRLAFDPANYRRTPVRGRDGFDLATHYAREPPEGLRGHRACPGCPTTS